MTNPCNAVQEAIAWNRELDDDGQRHLLQCDACRAFLEQITALDDFVTENADVEVPRGFAERVMSRITGEAVPRASAVALLFERRSLRAVVMQIALAVGVTNVFRFVLGLLLPSTAWGGP